MRVLVLDDALGATLARLLTGAGHTAQHAGTLETALRLLRLGPYDVVLTDMHLPDAEGDVVVLALREAPGVRLVLTSGADDLAAFARRHGLPHLAKPFDLDDLLNAIVSEIP